MIRFALNAENLAVFACSMLLALHFLSFWFLRCFLPCLLELVVRFNPESCATCDLSKDCWWIWCRCCQLSLLILLHNQIMCHCQLTDHFPLSPLQDIPTVTMFSGQIQAKQSSWQTKVFAQWRLFQICL